MTLKDFTEENGKWVYKFDTGRIVIKEDDGFMVSLYEKLFYDGEYIYMFKKARTFNCLKLALICAQAWIQ
jgi:hypothetical protein